MLRKNPLPLLLFYVCALTPAKATVFSNLKDRFAELYVIEKSSSIDLKRMSLSVLVFPLILSLYTITCEDYDKSDETESEQMSNENKHTLISDLLSLIIPSIINGLILYYSFRLKAVGWIPWVFKIIILTFVFTFISWRVEYAIGHNWDLGYLGMCAMVLLVAMLQGLLPYALYRCMIYFFPIQHTQHLILTEKSTL